MQTTADNSVTARPAQHYWHLFGGESDGAWMHAIIGGTAEPATERITGLAFNHPMGEGAAGAVPYLATFDHEPTLADLDAHTAPGFRSWEVEE